MKAYGVELPGTAEEWAGHWCESAFFRDSRVVGWQLADIRRWVSKRLDEAADPRMLWKRRGQRHQIEERLADRIAQAGKRVGLWSFTDGRWRGAP